MSKLLALILLLFFISCECESQLLNNNLLLSKSESTFPFSAEALAVFSKIETGSGELLTSDEKIAVARFVDSQVLDGNWSKIYAFNPLRGLSTETKCLPDWINSNVYTKTGTPAWSQSNGFTCSVTNYLRTGFIPSTGNGGASVPLNDTGYSIGQPTFSGFTQMGVIGSNANGQATIGMSSGSLSIKSHTDATATFASSLWNGNEIWVSNGRTSSSNYLMHLNAQRVRSASGHTSEVVPGRQIYIGCWNNNGTAAFGGNGSYDCFLVNQESNFNYQSFWVNYQYMLMELGAKAKTVLYPFDKQVHNYVPTDNLLINSEGQSNGLFAGTGSSLAAPYAHLANVIPNSKVFWAASGIPGNTVTLENLDFGVTNSYDAGGLAKYGGGLNMSYLLQRESKPPIITYWHYDISGSYLRNDNTPNWSPPTSGGLFTLSHTHLLVPGEALLTGPVRKLIFHWNQGEADQGRTELQYTTDFYAYLKAKIDAIQATGINLLSTEFHVVTPKIRSGLAGGADIRAAQAAFSIANFETAYPGYGQYIQTWTIYDNDDIIHGDGLHLDFEGYMIEGIRLAYWISRL